MFYNNSTMEDKNKILNIKVDARAAMPVYEQIKQGIKLQVMSGSLAPEAQLPPIRELASRLKVNANTIVKVYYQLDVEGFIYSQPGSGYFVRPDRKDEREDKSGLFGQVTDDYISRSISLGFSLGDMLKKVKERAGENDG